MKRKRCAKCHKRKPRKEYYKYPRAKDGLQSQCKSCMKKGSVLSHRRIKERIKVANEKSKRVRLAEEVIDLLPRNRSCPNCRLKAIIYRRWLKDFVCGNCLKEYVFDGEMVLVKKTG